MPTRNHVKINHRISGGTRVFGIIGNPVKYSLSPMIHNTISEFLGHDNAYVSFPLTSKEFIQEAVTGAHALGIKGFNVTHPYKEAVIPLLTHVDPLALKTGAVNTLKYEEEGYSGYNTDVDGLYQSLAQHKIDLQGKDVIVLGAGGGARAVCTMAAYYGARSICILNRTLNNAKILAMAVKKHYNVEIKALPLDQWSLAPENSICFQTTSLGMGESKQGSPIEDQEFYRKISIAVDLIYNPFKTNFLKNGEKQGSYIINGFGMLFFQAIKAYEIWNEMVFTNSQLTLLFDQIAKEYYQTRE